MLRTGVGFAKGGDGAVGKLGRGSARVLLLSHLLEMSRGDDLRKAKEGKDMRSPVVDLQMNLGGNIVHSGLASGALRIP